MQINMNSTKILQCNVYKIYNTIYKWEGVLTYTAIMLNTVASAHHLQGMNCAQLPARLCFFLE